MTTPLPMLRTVLGLRALLHGRASPAAPVWRDVSFRTMRTTAGARQWQSSTAFPQLLRNISRHGAKRPSRGALGASARKAQRRAFGFSSWRRSTGAGDKAPEKLSLGARLKKLSREYGWSAVGVYLALSVLDFPFCFLLVRVVGTETIGPSTLLRVVGGQGRSTGISLAR